MHDRAAADAEDRLWDLQDRICDELTGRAEMSAEVADALTVIAVEEPELLGLSDAGGEGSEPDGSNAFFGYNMPGVQAPRRRVAERERPRMTKPGVGFESGRSATQSGAQGIPGESKVPGVRRRRAKAQRRAAATRRAARRYYGRGHG